MLIEKQSLFSGKTHTMDLPVTQEQIAQWEAGAFIQDVLGRGGVTSFLQYV